MTNKGITLIEMMVIIAVIGIGISIFGDKDMLGVFTQQEVRLQEQERLFSFRNNVKTLLKKSKYAIEAVDRLVVFDNFRVIVSKDKTKAYVNKQLYEFNKVKIGGFEMISSQAVKLWVKNGLNSYELCWVAEAYEPEEQQGKDENANLREPAANKQGENTNE